jgi:hypothetical protein
MTVDDWIAARVPPVPSGFRPWLARALAEAPEREGSLGAEARSLLVQASEGRGEREGAFDLLVADALATWAAEATLEHEDAQARLEELVRALAR